MTFKKLFNMIKEMHHLIDSFKYDKCQNTLYFEIYNEDKLFLAESWRKSSMANLPEDLDLGKGCCSVEECYSKKKYDFKWFILMFSILQS